SSPRLARAVARSGVPVPPAIAVTAALLPVSTFASSVATATSRPLLQVPLWRAVTVTTPASLAAVSGREAALMASLSAVATTVALSAALTWIAMRRPSTHRTPGPVTAGAVMVMVQLAALPTGSATGSAQIGCTGAVRRAGPYIAASIEPAPN